MNRVDFYVLNRKLDACYHYTCRLIEKAYELKNDVYIYFSSQETACYFDDLLWTFKDTNFLPHHIYHDETSLDAPILLGYPDLKIPKEKTILINFNNDVPNFYKEFSRIIELVPDEYEIQTLTRQKYRQYQSFGCQIQTFHIK